MAKAGSRVKITLRCSECKQRNYNTNKNKRNTTERLELNKYCPFCRKHTQGVRKLHRREEGQDCCEEEGQEAEPFLPLAEGSEG